jgi:hypothetical protein
VTASEALDIVRQLRAMGARRVCVGGIEAEWPGAPAVLAVEPDEVPADVAQRRDAEEYERTLFHSSGGATW